MSSNASQSRTLSRILDGPLSEDDRREARQLIKHGLQLNECDTSGSSPLICAVRSKHFEFAMLLLQHGADVDTQNSFGWTALQYLLPVIDEEHANLGIDLAGEIVRRGAQVDLSRIFERPPRCSILARFIDLLLDMRPEFVRSLRVPNFPVPQFSYRYIAHSMRGTLLHLIVGRHVLNGRSAAGPQCDANSQCASLSLMRRLISLGADVDCPTKWSHELGDEDEEYEEDDEDEENTPLPQTPLGIAVQHHCFDVVQLLLQARADPNVPICLSGHECGLAQTSSAYTMLMHAAYSHNICIMKALIQASANVNACIEEGSTALTQALQRQSAESVQALRLLIEASADCNVMLSSGRTALALAIKCQFNTLSSMERSTSSSRSISLELLCRKFKDESAFMILVHSGARVSQNEVQLAADFLLPNVARYLLRHGGSFKDTLAHSRGPAFLGPFLYPTALLVASCKIPHSTSRKLPPFLPLPPTPPPLRLRALCVGGLSRCLLRSLARPILSELQLPRKQAARVLQHVLRYCTGLAGVHSFAAMKNADPVFVQLNQDFAIACGLAGFSWLPEREEIMLEEEQVSSRARKCVCTLL
jgi:ankyrin repeat protein